jgi:hypothetical protein
MTNPSHSKARTAGRDNDGSYYADGRTVFRNPVATVNPSGGKNITLGFPVCNLHDACPDEGAAIIAQCLNAHDDLVAALREARELIKSCFGDECAETEEMDAPLASLPAPQVRG